MTNPLLKKISALRSTVSQVLIALEQIETELSAGIEKTPKNKNAFRQQLEECEVTNSWRKPVSAKKKKVI